jgi:hypothetical protein
MLNASDHMARRNEQMRRARNAAFYRDNCNSGKTQQEFRKLVREHVANARAENRYMVRIFKRWH